ncbi:MAG: hypothetical protein Q8P56_01060 [Candidatus Uhrbacteria bacterium]|nr:hypothetical protein [Candidatus Uhrbacteria bacterium]
MTVQTQKLPVRIFEALTPFLIVTIFALVVVSIFYYIIQPALQNYLPGGPLNIGTVQELLKSRKLYKDDLNGLFSFYTSSKTAPQDPLAMIFPSDKDVPTLYALFEKLAKDSDIGLQVIDISENGTDAKNTKGQIRKVPISLRFVNVDYAGLKRVISVLESNIRLTAIDNFSYDPINKTVSFSIATYYFTERAQN